MRTWTCSQLQVELTIPLLLKDKALLENVLCTLPGAERTFFSAETEIARTSPSRSELVDLRIALYLTAIHDHAQRLSSVIRTISGRWRHICILVT